MKVTTPTLFVDKAICLKNIERMAEKARRNQLVFRPHFKTHQSVAIGRWYRQLGVSAITVSSVKMASYFATDGWNDITIAFPFNILEIEELNTLLEETKINIIVDNFKTVEFLKNKLSSEIGVFIEITTGYNRSGISAEAISEIEQLTAHISANKKLNFKGFLTHAGQTYHAKSTNELLEIHFHSVTQLAKLRDRFIEQFPEIEISIGDTPGCSLSEHFEGVNEIRPGNFVFYDLMQVQIGSCQFEDIAVRVACPVVSKQELQNEIVVYGGAIHFSKDSLIESDGKIIYGRIIMANEFGIIELLSDDNYLCRLSQEHGVVKVTRKIFDQLKIGDLIEIIPVHSCLTVHAMGKMRTTEDEEIEIMSRF